MILNHPSNAWLGVACVLVFLCFPLRKVEAKDWRGIVPLRSTSENVVDTLGISPTGSVHNYVLDDLKVSFQYQYEAGEQTCQEYPRYYNVPAMTVVSIEITPTHYISLRELSINLKSFRLIPQRFHGGLKSGFYLFDEQSGIGLTLHEDHSVDTITYLPSLADEEIFSCPDQSKKKERSSVEQKLDLSSILYSDILNIEKRLLSGQIEDQMEILDELVLAMDDEIFGYRFKYTLPNTDYLSILNAILNSRIRHDWVASAPIDLLDWGKICFTIQSLMLKELSIPLSKFLEIEDPAVQLRLLETLRRLGEKESRYDIIFLLEEPSISPNVEEAALDTLVDFQAEEVIPFLEKYVGTRGAYSTHQALRGLIRIGGEKTVPGLLKGLEIPDHGLRKLAIRGLTAAGGPLAIESLVKSLDLEDRYSDFRKEAVKGLIRLQATKYYPKFWKILENQIDHNHYLRSPAFVALLSIGDARATALFFEKLQMRNSPFQQDFYQSLRDLDAQVLVPPLINILEQHKILGGRGIESQSTLQNIIVFLKDMQATEAASVLMTLMESSYGVIREKAIEALGELGIKESIPMLKKIAEVEFWTWEDRWKFDPCMGPQLRKLYPDGLPPNFPDNFPKDFTFGLCSVHPRKSFIAGEAALALLKLGVKTLIPDIRDHWDSYKFSPGRLFSLTRPLNPPLWDYLHAFKVQGYNRAPVHIVIQAFEKEAKVKIILPENPKQEEARSFTSIDEQKKMA